ncbi:ATP-binding protein [Streptomyces sp. NPDC038707]|uniref:ATP-binding protein n=1 Tax=Streptomyces sp. NPDC038707 TaxID=3154329 RepID=UPI0033D8731B
MLAARTCAERWLHVLVVAELAANAVLHGRVPGRDFELRLSFDRAAGVVRVEVSDTHPVRPQPNGPAAPSRPLDAEGGRGLLLVAAVATRWGVGERRGPGKAVWAECEVPPPAAASGAGCSARSR